MMAVVEGWLAVVTGPPSYRAYRRSAMVDFDRRAITLDGCSFTAFPTRIGAKYPLGTDHGVHAREATSDAKQT